MNARIDEGRLVVGPYISGDLEPCFIAVGSRGPGEWQPAFKSRRGAERVLQIKPPAGSGTVKVWVKISGAVSAAGSVRL